MWVFDDDRCVLENQFSEILSRLFGNSRRSVDLVALGLADSDYWSTELDAHHPTQGRIGIGAPGKGGQPHKILVPFAIEFSEQLAMKIASCPVWRTRLSGENFQPSVSKTT